MGAVAMDVRAQPAVAGQGEILDMLIVGAGLSGVAAAQHLQSRLPGKRYLILEGRDAIGGTWDLFRYPGVRSDSDMHTLGYSFRPWLGEKAITDGASIADYVRDTARELGIDRHIRFGHRVVRASWSSAEALWTVQARVGADDHPAEFRCRFLFMCSGYYDYAEGYLPDWAEMARFKGALVHPQHWPEDLDYAGKRVVVIGSGATAVTLVPEMAGRAAHVTMLQRSPTYIVARPARDAVADWLNRRVPARLAHALTRWKNVLLNIYFYSLARRRPAQVKQAIIALARKELGPDFDVATHLTPRYNPWDQRVCLVPDADLFAALRSGKASIVTAEIERFTETGLELRGGERLDADVIVTATGLKVKLLGGVEVVVDGAPVDVSKALSYKGMMLSDVPNMAFALGYTNASWTLKCELTAEYACRLIAHMDARGYVACIPARPASGMAEEPALNLSSGYVKRAEHLLPKQGSKAPWKIHQNYALDLMSLRFGSIEDGVMRFTRPQTQASPARAA